MTTDSGKKPRDSGYIKGQNMVRKPTPCPNCERLEDQLYHESRKAPEIEYKLGHEIETLKARLAMCKEALKYYRGSDDDETSWMEPDQYVPYWTLWHDGNNVGGKVASECMEKLEGEK